MDNLNIIYIESDFSSVCILGRRAEEYILREFGQRRIARDIAEAREMYVKGAVNVAIPLNMPLVKREDILRAAALMKRRGFASLQLGERGGEGEIRIADSPSDGIFVCDEAFFKINSAKSFNSVYNHLRQRITDGLLEAGVYIPDAQTVHIDDTVLIEAGAKILPFSRIEGDAVIREGASVYASYITGGEISRGATVELSRLNNSRVGEGAAIGPFARLRDAEIGKGARIGDFVEIKASSLAEGVKAAHLSYVGDADVGAHTNIGCGTVFCNYDGRAKHKTSVGEGCFIGANTNLVAPISVGERSFVAAGTTVTRDIEEGSFVIARPETKIKKNKRVGISDK